MILHQLNESSDYILQLEEEFRWEWSNEEGGELCYNTWRTIWLNFQVDLSWKHLDKIATLHLCHAPQQTSS